MSFVSLTFIFFLILFLIVYYAVPTKYRYWTILVGSYIFYGWLSPKICLILLLTTILTYVGGIVISRYRKKSVYALFFLLTLAILFIFKYTDFAIDNINRILSLHGSTSISTLSIALPVGLSFYVFQSCSYLGDVYRNKIEAEKNFARYAAYVSFFPTILSGPIQKSRELLPQITNPKEFDGDNASKGLILFIWGLFEKLLVANKLFAIVNRVYSDYTNFDTAYYIVAAISFSLYIYSDFSSYSDMSRGIAKFMGIEVGKNFLQPYLSESTGEFWVRWHKSLSEWLKENLYIPLGGNRKGKIRKYLNEMVIFLFSGFWHGAAWHFIVWGGVNGIFVVIGQALKPLKNAAYKRLNIDEHCISIKVIKKAIVFWLITITWVFFSNGIDASLHIIRNMTLFYPVRLFEPDLLQIAGSYVTTFITVVMTSFFCIIQEHREKEGYYYRVFKKQPYFIQCASLAILLVACIFAASSATTQINTQFIYFNF